LKNIKERKRICDLESPGHLLKYQLQTEAMRENVVMEEGMLVPPMNFSWAWS
jgi:hypothetical protein